MKFIHFNPETGELRHSAVVADPVGYMRTIESLGKEPGRDFQSVSVSEGVNLQEWYWAGTLFKKRPVMPVELSKAFIVANDADVSTMSGVLRGAKVHIVSGETPMEIDADGTDIELTSRIPAVYKIRAELWPYMPVIKTITAVEVS